MEYYFQLQYLMINRKIAAVGIHPHIAYIGGSFVFVIITMLLFYKTVFAPYIVILTCVSMLSSMSESHRLDFLSLTFGDRIKNKIRLLEIGVVCIPFLLALMVYGCYWEALALMIIAFVQSKMTHSFSYNLTLPTPFSNRPFEFLVGFRKSFLLILFAYVLSIIGMYVGNENLAIFAMLFVMLIAMGYHYSPERQFYIWIYQSKPAGFLIHKITTATLYTIVLAFPILGALAIVFPSALRAATILFLLGMLYVWTFILAKYASYPREMHLPEFIMLTFSVYFPPIILIFLPYFYRKATQNLSLILHDSN